MIKKMPTPITITTKEIRMLTGKHVRTAQRLTRKVREHFGISMRNFITISEYCIYTNQDEKQVRERLGRPD